jgi:hypothetical protein
MHGVLWLAQNVMLPADQQRCWLPLPRICHGRCHAWSGQYFTFFWLHRSGQHAAALLEFSRTFPWRQSPTPPIFLSALSLSAASWTNRLQVYYPCAICIWNGPTCQMQPLRVPVTACLSGNIIDGTWRTVWSPTAFLCPCWSLWREDNSEKKNIIGTGSSLKQHCVSACVGSWVRRLRWRWVAHICVEMATCMFGLIVFKRDWNIMLTCWFGFVAGSLSSVLSKLEWKARSFMVIFTSTKWGASSVSSSN